MRQLVLFVSFAVFGTALTVVGAMLSGMAEGSAAAMAIFGSPFTLLSVMAWWSVVTWTIVGALIAARRLRWARVVVILHYLCAPFAVYGSLRNPGDWREDWRLQQLTCHDEGWICVLLLLPYVAGQIGVWSALRREKV